uniref:Carboxypeptidase n=1 Tax=Leptobrachium leishanense TaxID=445787 RepID=A0A8C5R6K0_9ANUR
MSLLLLCLLLLGCLPSRGAPPADEIRYMPGLTPQTSFRHYSGYLNVSDSEHLFYWFVEAQEDSRSSPVVLWLNGGPGCSSLNGLLTGNGPFLVQPDGETLEYNPYSWNKISNVLYLESPAGVGFSYSDDMNYRTNDTAVAEYNYKALKEFFHLFPEFQENDFYITGESYAGIYVPTLAVRVSEDSSINLKGIAVGNGIFNYNMNDNSVLYFSYYHGFVDSHLWSLLQTYCCKGGKCSFKNVQSLMCLLTASEVRSAADYAGVNPYNIYQQCSDESPGLIRDDGDHITLFHPGFYSSSLDSHFRKKLSILSGSKKPVKMSAPCVNSTALTRFLNKQDVRAVLRVPSGAPEWKPCCEQVFIEYRREIRSVHKQFKKLLEKEYRILVYSGDIDMVCNFLGNEWFVDSLNLTLSVNHHAWFYTEDGQQQVGGFVKEFPNLAFLTVKGAGHMVPTDKPNPAFVMFNRYINNEPF